MNFLKSPIRRFVRQYCGLDVVRWRHGMSGNPFDSHYYHRNTRRRLEHLASLNLDIWDKSVFEVGAGAGDHTDFFLDRNCKVVATEARQELLPIIRAKHGNRRVEIFQLDLNSPNEDYNEQFNIVYCYGLLYHLHDPESAIKYLADRCSGMALIATIVSYDQEKSITYAEEDPKFLLHSVSGTGCRPSRLWVYEELKKHFSHVYLPVTQPNYPQFPIDWTSEGCEPLPQAIFIASRTSIENKLLVEEIPLLQRRH